MEELRIGDPALLATDVGPVIDADARHKLVEHIERMKSRGCDIYQLPLDPVMSQGTFVAPTILEIVSLTELEHEVFGPVLHVLRYKRDELPQLVDEINASGFGLTLGIHTRIDETTDYIVSNARVGNIYVNRSIVGAVVGVQPFGGEGKSGAGPKAGGPFYLKRLQQNPAVEFGALNIENHLHSDMNLQTSNELLMWARTHGREHLATIAEQYIKTSGLHATATLSGPTGERNTLSLAPRGNVLCTATGEEALLNQLAAAFATGNSAYVLATGTCMIPADWPSSLRDRIRLVEIAELPDFVFHAAMMESSQATLLRPLLAERDGALVSVLITTEDALIPLWRLLTERTVCVNTTATGGNASLMTLTE
jgi:RHH-type proline utilization regulon transcriptional repressor/proline dehydrogenase/delta 1-pyrroline-5-carboxylate dehydrogenase